MSQPLDNLQELMGPILILIPITIIRRGPGWRGTKKRKPNKTKAPLNTAKQKGVKRKLDKNANTEPREANAKIRITKLHTSLSLSPVHPFQGP